ncbi:MAG: aspartate/glutamate racemase family protein [Desulfovibrio sp.]|nr:aspartate/glutamate racemase family protein [Desulfovibrio sp.]
MRKPERICGILGGMGPEATVYLMNRIIANTDAGEDGHHVRCLVDQNPQVPSRIKAILEGAEDPGPDLAKMASGLEAAGSDFLCMPCNTAHYWLSEITSGIKTPFLDMPDLACMDAARAAPGAKCGIMATPATRLKGIYDARCARHGLEAIYPAEDDQAALLEIINEVKAGNHGGGRRLAAIAARLAQAGASSVILACTELSVLGVAEENGLKVIDALESLAREIVSRAGADSK